MKNRWLFLGLFFVYSLLFSACTTPTERVIRTDEVFRDSVSDVLLLKKNKEKVTGIVVEKYWDEFCKDSVQRKFVVEEGKIQKSGDYYLSGGLYREYLKSHRRINFYYPSGSLWKVTLLNQRFLDSMETIYDTDGLLVMKILMDYSKKEKMIGEYKKGVQIKESIYNENGDVIKSYDCDEDGNKIIPDIEKLELLKYQTGFYRYADYTRGEVLFQPMVIMKWKNISGEALTENIKITGVFISGSEEWSTDDTYFQTSYGTPLQSGLTRQANVTSSVGFTNVAGIVRANVKCQLYINKQLYKTIKIQNKELHSNRMQ